MVETLTFMVQFILMKTLYYVMIMIIIMIIIVIMIILITYCLIWYLGPGCTLPLATWSWGRLQNPLK